ncbi:hypothetical protein GJ496_002845 [Pomphorhynchus laevis]|nr:hypothetical protein GJ496_002845 [Pomphorhynchus laevis]
MCIKDAQILEDEVFLIAHKCLLSDEEIKSIKLELVSDSPNDHFLSSFDQFERKQRLLRSVLFFSKSNEPYMDEDALKLLIYDIGLVPNHREMQQCLSVIERKSQTELKYYIPSVIKVLCRLVTEDNMQAITENEFLMLVKTYTRNDPDTLNETMLRYLFLGFPDSLNTNEAEVAIQFIKSLNISVNENDESVKRETVIEKYIQHMIPSTHLEILQKDMLPH